MGREASESIPAAQQLFDEAKAILGYDLQAVCYDGPAEKLNSTAFSQPALFVCGLAAYERFKAERPEEAGQCDAVAGLSLGEYTALVVAGVLDFETALRVVQIRGEAMQAAADANPSGMVSLLGMTPESVEQLCQECREEGEVLQIANLLCPGNIVVSGHKPACARITERAVDAGAMKAIPLTVAGAFHTSLMDSAVDRLRDALADAEMHDAKIPVIANVDATPHTKGEDFRSLLPKQVVSPVRWEDSIRFLLDNEHNRFFELGPGRVLTGLMKRIHRKTPCENISC